MFTTKFVRLLQAKTISEVGSVRRSSHDRVVERLSDLQFITRAIQTNAAGQLELELQILDEDLLYELLSGEANRFLLAAILSHSRARQIQEANAAWQAIEHYYSAYYSIHYLLRMTGRSLTSLDGSAVRAIENNFFNGALPQTIPEGLYELNYNYGLKTLILTKKTKGGGSHKDAWSMWVRLVSELKVVAAGDLAEYASEDVTLAAHKGFVLKSTDKYRPPEIRGEINYQFRGGSWRFEKDSAKSISILQRGILDSSILPNSTSDSYALLKHNDFIYSLAANLFQSVAENYPRSIARSLHNKYCDVMR